MTCLGSSGRVTLPFIRQKIPSWFITFISASSVMASCGSGHLKKCYFSTQNTHPDDLFLIFVMDNVAVGQRRFHVPGHTVTYLRTICFNHRRHSRSGTVVAGCRPQKHYEDEIRRLH